MEIFWNDNIPFNDRFHQGQINDFQIQKLSDCLNALLRGLYLSINGVPWRQRVDQSVYDFFLLFGKRTY